MPRITTSYGSVVDTFANEDVMIERLITLGVVRRTSVRGRYYILSEGATHRFQRRELLARFTLSSDLVRYTLRRQPIANVMAEAHDGGWVWVNDIPTRRITVESGNVSLNTEPAPAPRELRRLTRSGYHCGTRHIREALEEIPYDEDGVRRSFGIEYEIYSLNEEQEDKLVGLLETLPSHVTERDASLGTNGVEIVFDPLSADEYVRVVKVLGDFVRDNRVVMESAYGGMAGMHTTYGVSNGTASKDDLQIRLNRFALAVKAVGTQGNIRRLFGRDFGDYRELPRGTLYTTHSNAFSTNGRPATCWECRLPSWSCDPEKMVEFLKATEVAFYRPVKAEDFIKVFEILGADTTGC